MKVKYDFIRKFAFYSLVQKSYALYRAGKTTDILFGKINPFNSQKNRSKLNNKLHTKEKNRYFSINKAIFETLKKSHNNPDQNYINITS